MIFFLNRSLGIAREYFSSSIISSMFISQYSSVKKIFLGNSLAVQCLGLHAFTAMARVHFLVRELKSCKPRSVAKKKKKKKDLLL